MGGHTIQPEQVGKSSQVTPERHESHLSGVTYWQPFNTSPSQISPPNSLVLFLWSVIFPQGKKGIPILLLFTYFYFLALWHVGS